MGTEVMSLRMEKTLVDGYRVAAKRLGLPMQKVLQGTLFLGLVSLDVSQPGRVAFKRRSGE